MVLFYKWSGDITTCRIALHLQNSTPGHLIRSGCIVVRHYSFTLSFFNETTISAKHQDYI